MLHARPPKDVTKFNPHCLIGNWNEDRQLQRTLLKQLLANKATGTLKLDSYQQKLSVALRDVELTREADDGLVRFGDVLQLVHVDTGCVLADDVSDKDTRPGEEACAATAAPQIRSPCARNAFILLPYRPPRTAPLEPEYGDNVVRYGQKLRVAAYPEADGQPVDREGGPRPLCLFSKPVSVTHASKYSRKQLVGFTYRSTFDTVWQVVTPDPSQRSLSEGVEVMAGAPVLLVHCATQKPLAVEPQRYPNDFGIELELTARSATSHGLKLANEQAAQGVHKGFLPKGESSDNYWTFINGTKVATLPEPAAPSSEGARIVEALVRELSGGTLYDLERKLVLLEDGHCELPADELALVLKQVGSSITEDAIAALTASFAVQSRSRTIDARALLGTIRETRQRLALPV